ncbi:PE domain-containing protein [Actinokineospora guangxiensis]|uniref:PE domain-containing protein n=1 Tax=Actinokineospora guangxiensis TaxID=1490288 RepID=A0ABW0EHD5_9PSEU
MDATGIGGAVGAFAGAAASGMVSVDPDAAQAAIKEIGAVRDELSALLHSASAGGASSVQIGANPVGVAMAKKSENRMSGSGDSFTHLIRQLFDQTERAERALNQAIANYKETDYGNAAKVRG